jgi:hypothetical protein
MYNFTLFTVQLNEPESGVAPTDSRLRTDQRLMEENDWDRANEEKLKLEQMQRNRRAEKEYQPIWFKKAYNKLTGEEDFNFTNEYWECKKNQDWKKCPILF